MGKTLAATIRNNFLLSQVNDYFHSLFCYEFSLLCLMNYLFSIYEAAVTLKQRVVAKRPCTTGSTRQYHKVSVPACRPCSGPVTPCRAGTEHQPFDKEPGKLLVAKSSSKTLVLTHGGSRFNGLQLETDKKIIKGKVGARSKAKVAWGTAADGGRRTRQRTADRKTGVTRRAWDGWRMGVTQDEAFA